MPSFLRRSTLAALLVLLIPTAASAFSVRVHIHLANAIREDAMANFEADGIPRIRLKGPDGQPAQYVRLSPADFAAIRDYPEYWRGGAIGPDNTVAPGLTDPSHAWMYSPFQQCQALLQNVRAEGTPGLDPVGAERAYALGCFLHGISDNAAHHMVNYFSGETFTLTPVDAAKDGDGDGRAELGSSFLNVVRHIYAESRFENALAEAIEPPMREALAQQNPSSTPEQLDQLLEQRMADSRRHKIARDLYRRTYFVRDDGSGQSFWRDFMGDLMHRKKTYLAEVRVASLYGEEARTAGLDEALDKTVEYMRSHPLDAPIDIAVFRAYAEFLGSGGNFQMGTRVAEMAPADYVLFLPEIVDDMRKLMIIVNHTGKAKIEQTPGWRIVTKRFYTYLFGPQDVTAQNPNGMSRWEQVMEQKNRELDNVMLGYIETVERLSNVVVRYGLAHAPREELRNALQPLRNAIAGVTSIDRSIWLPAWANAIIDEIQWLQSFIDGFYDFIHQKVEELVIAKLEAYLLDLSQELLGPAIEMAREVQRRVNESIAAAIARMGAQRVESLGIQLDDAHNLLTNFTQSVYYMNAFNSVAGVLANQTVVLGDGRGMFAGPVSFDASYQLYYNQLAVCDDLRSTFYPCGLSVSEMLQPDFHTCKPFPADAQLQPPIECHAGSTTSFARLRQEGADAEEPAGPSSEEDPCWRTPLPGILSDENNHFGSYTLAFPPDFAPEDDRPECVNPFSRIGGTNGSGDFERSNAGLGGGGGSSLFGEAGCSVAQGSQTQGWFAIGALAALITGLAFRRQRRGSGSTR